LEDKLNYTTIQTYTIRDNTGNKISLPALLINQGGNIDIFWPLHMYLLNKQRLKSISWKKKLIQAVSLLLDYMSVNYQNFANPKDFFDSFTEAIYVGTINEDGYDPSGLYWLPKRAKTARPLLQELSEFADWVSGQYSTIPLNPWRKATKYEELLNWAAINEKSNYSFLGHLDDPSKMTETAKKARYVVQRRIPLGDHAGAKAFPEDKIDELLWKGFKISDADNLFDQYNWRDIAITILMHGGGLRKSEPFHLWIQDVQPDPYDPDLALVRVYHPIEGMAPKDFKLPDGRYPSNREAYLRIKYGLKPRNELPGIRHAGWKRPKMSDAQQNYMQVFWFPSVWGYLFMKVWKIYMLQRIHEEIPDDHPYLFVSFKSGKHGDMYSIGSFHQSYTRAVEKIGLDVGKMLGTTEHGQRHAYGQRAKNAGLDELTIQAMMHHKSMKSQEIYTAPTISEVTKKLAEASHALENDRKLPMNIDPDVLFRQERKFPKKWIQRKGKQNDHKKKEPWPI
jgi:site-specific recombinase XerD